jgi:hypothetical protein
MAGPIVMGPKVLYRNNSNEYCKKITTLMSKNKTFVRVPKEKLDNCTFASLLIPGWYETNGFKVAELFCHYKDGNFIDVDNLDQECNLQNYIWPSDALGKILNGNITINSHDAMFGMKNQGISFNDFMIYIYENNLLNDKEKKDFQLFYNNKDSLDWGQDLINFSNKHNLKLELERLIRDCFKTYSDFVLFVKNVKRTPNLYCGNEEWKTKDYQEYCMFWKYTETLLPEHKKLVGLYVPSMYKCKTKEKYNELKELAIKNAKELNISVFSLEELK